MNASALAYDRQFTWTLCIAGAIFIAVQLLLAGVVLRAKRTRTFSTNPRHGHRALELGWTLATAALFIGLSVAGSRSWATLPTADPQAGTTSAKETVEVYAHQFAWTFRYPGQDGQFGRTSRDFVSDAGGNSTGLDPEDPAGKDDRVSAKLVIPAGRDVLLLLHSRDVIHDFFVRELRTKQDVVPGMEIPFEIHVDRPGTYEIACAELCGLGHSQMRSFLVVLPGEEFDKWKRSP